MHTSVQEITHNNALSADHKKPRPLKSAVVCFMKYLITYILVFMVLSCGNPGDGRESFGDKKEWSILQQLEYETRKANDIDFHVKNINEYFFAIIPKSSSQGAIVIMLNPKHPPFYKQIPNVSFGLTIDQYNELIEKSPIISTVEEALKSHVE